MSKFKPNESWATKKKTIFVKGVQFFKKNGYWPNRADFTNIGISKDQLAHHFASQSNFQIEATKLYPELKKVKLKERQKLGDLEYIEESKKYKFKAPVEWTPTMRSTFNKFVNASVTQGNWFKRCDLKSIDVTFTQVKDNFISLEQMKQMALDTYPELRNAIQSEVIFNPDRAKNIDSEIAGYDTYVAITIYEKERVKRKAYDSLMTYIKFKKAKLLVKYIGTKYEDIDPKFINETMIWSDLYLTEKTLFSAQVVSSTSKDPFTGIKGVGERNITCIVGGPIISKRNDAVAENTSPHELYCTGTMSLPDEPMFYKTKREYDKSKNTDLTALVIEVYDKKEQALVRDLRFDDKMGFADADGYYYSQSKRTWCGAERIVPGDIHAGEHDKRIIAANAVACKFLGIKEMFLNDFLNGLSINHHIEKDLVTKLRLFKMGITLDAELKKCHEMFNYFFNVAGVSSLKVVPSNHDEWLDKYIKEALYTKDVQNYDVASDIQQGVKHGFGALEYYFRVLNKVTKGDSITFLKRDEPCKRYDVDFNVHGDQGANGSKGMNVMTGLISHGAFVKGHSHSSAIYRRAVSVGTSTILRSYNHGASNWDHSYVIQFFNGATQLIVVKNGYITKNLRVTDKDVAKVPEPFTLTEEMTDIQAKIQKMMESAA